jgi:hypothetical protein
MQQNNGRPDATGGEGRPFLTVALEDTLICIHARDFSESFQVAVICGVPHGWTARRDCGGRRRRWPAAVCSVRNSAFRSIREHSMCRYRFLAGADGRWVGYSRRFNNRAIGFVSGLLSPGGRFWPPRA